MIGPVQPELEAFSEEVDLLVCGSRQTDAFRRVVFGSTSGYLAHHARCPLLITPAPADTDTKTSSGRISAPVA